MNVKRAVCLVLALILLVGAAGCRSITTEDSASVSSGSAERHVHREMQLLYSYSDSFNPYLAATDLNRQLMPLLYEPLFAVNDSLRAEPRLAESAVMKGKTCTVRLKNAYFSDGSAVTASDVTASFKKAKSSARVYAQELYEVKSVSARDGRTVVFELTRQDPYFTALLDFPILKAGSDSRKNSDGVLLPPVGSGRYTVSDSRDELLRNPSYYGAPGNVERIRLINAPDTASISHYVEIGAADFYYTDISDGNIVRMSGKKTDINLNNLVYVGINDSVSGLMSRELRYAVSCALDRDAICQGAYYNNAVSANGFFSPAFEATRAVQTIKNNADLQIAIENLEKIGYNKTDGKGYRVNAAGKRLSLTLLVNQDNGSRLQAAQMIVDQLKSAGIEVKLISRNFKEYSAAIAAKSFQLYLGEVRVLNNMDFSALVLPGGTAAFGVGEAAKKSKAAAKDKKAAKDTTDEADKTASGSDETEKKDGEDTPEKAPGEAVAPATVADIIDGFYQGKNTVNDVAVALLTDLPVIPVCYRKGLLFTGDIVLGAGTPSAGDIYSGFDAYHIQ